MKIYTKTGDKGTTSLLGGGRVEKNHPKLEAYGTVDELNSWIGVIRSSLREYVDKIEVQKLSSDLEIIQKDLFLLASHIACVSDEHRQKFKLADFDDNKTAFLESKIDEMDQELEPLKNFILPYGAPPSAQAHIARTVCRRAERLIYSTEDFHPEWIRYINRLSDYFFTLARYINKITKIPESLWTNE